MKGNETMRRRCTRRAVRGARETAREGTQEGIRERTRERTQEGHVYPAQTQGHRARRATGGAHSRLAVPGRT